MSIYFYNIIKKIILKHVIKFNKFHDLVKRTEFDLIYHCLNIFFKVIIFKFFLKK